MEYPDRWVLVEFITPTVTLQKVFCGWYGGYTGGDAWRMSSQIVDIEDNKDHYVFHTESGNEYICHKQALGMSGYMSSIYVSWENKLPPGTSMRIVDSINEIAV